MRKGFLTKKRKGRWLLWIAGLILGLALWGCHGREGLAADCVRENPAVEDSQIGLAAEAAGNDLAAEAESADGTLDGLLDYGQIQSVINDADEDSSISFSQIVASLFNGDLTMTFEGIGQYIYDHIFSEIDANRKSILQIIGIAVLGAVFTNFSVAFAKNYVARTGFYMTYLILFSLLLTAFLAAFSVAGSVLDFLVEFMSALLPAFCTAIAFAAGTASAAGFYGVTALAIAAVDWLICHGLLGLIQTYMILSLVNEISREDRLSRLCGLIRTVISWSLKTMLGLTLGLNIIQGMVLPAFDSFKNSAFMKLSSIIPGIGSALNAAARTAIGSGVLIKNAIGVGGLIVIVIICAVPLIKLLVITLMYKVAEAVVQPVSDERITECIRITADSVLLLLMAAGTAILLFVLSLAVIASASNLSVGGG